MPAHLAEGREAAERPREKPKQKLERNAERKWSVADKLTGATRASVHKV